MSLIISILSIAISAITAWFTLFKRGNIKMTQPSIIFFGPDGLGGSPKVFLRTLLYSTGKRGLLIENMYIKLCRMESVQNFNIWVYGEAELVRGSGLYVGENGIAHNHHFLLPKDGTDYIFLKGKYDIYVYAKIVNRKKQVLLGRYKVTLTDEQENLMRKKEAGVYFDWGPDQQDYQSHVELHPKKELLDILSNIQK